MLRCIGSLHLADAADKADLHALGGTLEWQLLMQWTAPITDIAICQIGIVLAEGRESGPGEQETIWLATGRVSSTPSTRSSRHLPTTPALPPKAAFEAAQACGKVSGQTIVGI